MQTIAIALAIAGLIGAGYYIKSIMAQNKELKIEMNLKETQIINIQKDLNTITNSVVEQNNQLEILEKKITIIDTEAKNAIQVFIKHDLEKVSKAKPALVEKRVNMATQAVFLAIMQDTIAFNKGVTQ